jgi:hypothetical protein
MLTVDVLFVGKPVKDAWVLEGIVPAFIVYSLLLGYCLLVGESRLALLNAAIAIGVLAIIPSVKYGFVYGEYDPIGHFATALEIARTGSIAGESLYSTLYAATPLLHIFLAVMASTAALPVEATIVCVLFAEHFVILILVAESAGRMFPQIDKRLVAFLTVTTVPVAIVITGTTFGLLSAAMLLYLFSASIGRGATRGHLLATAILMVSLIFCHLVTTLYFLVVLLGYSISLLIMTGSEGLRRRFSHDPVVKLVPLFLTVFFCWLVYVGPLYVDTLHSLLTTEFFTRSSLPSTAERFPLTDLIQLFLFNYTRSLFSVFMALGVSSIALVTYRKTNTFLLFWWLLAGSLLLGAIIGLGFEFGAVWRFLAYASLTTPYFLCRLVSRGKHMGYLLTPRIRVIMLTVLVISMVAAYPITPLYPVAGGQPILDDNSVNSVYAVSGLGFFSSVYSSGRVLTSVRIFSQLMSLHPELAHLGWETIFPHLEQLGSPAELKEELLLFDAGGQSGTANLAMRALAPDLRNRLGIIYSNGLFYIAVAT